MMLSPTPTKSQSTNDQQIRSVVGTGECNKCLTLCATQNGKTTQRSIDELPFFVQHKRAN